LLRLGDAIREAETGIPWPSDTIQKKHAAKKPENRVTKIGPHAAAALRLLIFIGARLVKSCTCNGTTSIYSADCFCCQPARPAKKRLF
jgi:hypothetical protein